MHKETKGLAIAQETSFIQFNFSERKSFSVEQMREKLLSLGSSCSMPRIWTFQVSATTYER